MPTIYILSVACITNVYIIIVVCAVTYGVNYMTLLYMLLLLGLEPQTLKFLATSMIRVILYSSKLITFFSPSSLSAVDQVQLLHNLATVLGFDT